MQNQNLSAGLRARVALEKHGFKPSHSLGQNFILDDGFLSLLLDAAEVGETDHVLEIGPGPGVMTRMIAERAGKVLSIEMDDKLRPVLEEVLAGQENAELIFADAMRVDISAFVREKLDGHYRVIANLPYYITADLILRMLQARPLPESICVMVQKEAADRLMSNPGDKNWCALAATVRYFGDCEVLEDVPPHRFNPPPHVDSCFIRICIRRERLIPPEREDEFLKLVRCCFHMRRKTLCNNLKAVYGMKQETAAAAIDAAGLSPQVRGEVLTLADMARLLDALTMHST